MCFFFDFFYLFFHSKKIKMQIQLAIPSFSLNYRAWMIEY